MISQFIKFKNFKIKSQLIPVFAIFSQQANKII